MDAIVTNISKLIVRLGSLVTIDEAEAIRRSERLRYLGHVPYRVPNLIDEAGARVIE